MQQRNSYLIYSIRTGNIRLVKGDHSRQSHKSCFNNPFLTIYMYEAYLFIEHYVRTQTEQRRCKHVYWAHTSKKGKLLAHDGQLFNGKNTLFTTQRVSTIYTLLIFYDTS